METAEKIAIVVLTGLIVALLVVNFLSERCQHDWDVKTKEVLQSGIEQLAQHGTLDNASNIPMELFRKKTLVIMACKKCGDVDKTVAQNP